MSSMNHFESWAWYNRGFGWSMLMVYLLFGWVLSLNLENKHESLLKVFIVIAWLIACFEVSSYILTWYKVPGFEAAYRLEGFYQNPNSYGLSLVFLIALQIPFLNKRKLFPVWVHHLGLSLSCVACILSGSRSALITCLIVFIVAVLKRWNTIKNLAIQILIVSLLLLTFFLPYSFKRDASKEALQANTYVLRKDAFKDRGVQYRSQLFNDAIDLWKGSPWLGVGVGSFYTFQKKENPKLPMLIHSTPLWILTEMGLVGLFLFTLLHMSFFKIFWLEQKKAIPQSMILILICFAFISFLNDVMYQRYLWFFIGFALAHLKLNQKIEDGHVKQSG